LQRVRLNTGERKAQILKIATDVFYRDGYEKASLQEIAQKARITKAAIYYHFKNKEEILFNLVATLSDRLVTDLKEINKEGNDPIDQFREMLTQHISYMKQGKANVKILVEDKRFLKKRYADIIRDKQKEIFEIYRNKLEEIATKGRLRDINIITANFSLFGIMNWLYHWYDSEGKLSIEEITENIVQMVFYGLIKEEKTAVAEEGYGRREG
jgi:TetR/AcrR family transcriptional regulator, cholesterol catabolism regulator